MYSLFSSRIYKTIAKFVKSNDKLFAICLPIYNKLFAKDVMLQFILSKVKKHDVVYDVGAYRGSYSLAIAGKYSRALVYAFEPNPAAYLELVRNIEHAKLGKNIIPLNIALSDRRDRQKFHISAYAPLSSLHYSNATFHSTTAISQIIDVSCETIDYLVQSGKIKPPDIIKIDTEGNEHQVILGALNVINEFKPAIGFETHGTDDMQNSTIASIMKILSTAGYNCRRLDDIRCSVWCQRLSK
jgi:FkbM family methyltransferase